MKSGLSLTPIPSDTNKAGSKVTRHEEPGRTREAGSAGVPQQRSCSAFSVIMCQIMTSNTHFSLQIIYLPAARRTESGESEVGKKGTQGIKCFKHNQQKQIKSRLIHIRMTHYIISQKNISVSCDVKHKRMAAK